MEKVYVFQFFTKGGGVYKTWFCQIMILIQWGCDAHKTMVQKSLNKSLKNCQNPNGGWNKCHWMTSDAMSIHVKSYNAKEYIDIYLFGISTNFLIVWSYFEPNRRLIPIFLIWWYKSSILQTTVVYKQGCLCPGQSFVIHPLGLQVCDGINVLVGMDIGPIC